MKPYVICHMVASLDGRTLISRWQPEDARHRDLFEPLHDQLGADAWLIGRVSGQGYAKRDAYPDYADQRYQREAWFARRGARAGTVNLIDRGQADIHGSGRAH
jgi:hypothetical protein